MGGDATDSGKLERVPLIVAPSTVDGHGATGEHAVGAWQEAGIEMQL